MLVDSTEDFLRLEYDKYYVTLSRVGVTIVIVRKQ